MLRQIRNWLRSQAAAITRVPLKNAHCSFCRRSHEVAGPFAEGPDLVFICGDCTTACRNLIDEEIARGTAPPSAAGR